MWGDEEDIHRLVAIDDRRHNDRVQDVSVHETFELGVDLRIHQMTTQKVIRAREDGTDRNLLIYRAEDDVDVTRIVLTDLENCRVGRHRALPRTRFVAWEIIFDRALKTGETHMFSHRMDVSRAFLSDEELAERGVGTVAATEAGRAFRRPVLSVVIAAKFHPDAIPPRCYHVSSARLNGDLIDVGEVFISSSGSAHIAVQNVPLGAQGMRWEWD